MKNKKFKALIVSAEILFILATSYNFITKLINVSGIEEIINAILFMDIRVLIVMAVDWLYHEKFIKGTVTLGIAACGLYIEKGIEIQQAITKAFTLTIVLFLIALIIEKLVKPSNADKKKSISDLELRLAQTLSREKAANIRTAETESKYKDLLNKYNILKKEKEALEETSKSRGIDDDIVHKQIVNRLNSEVTQCKLTISRLNNEINNLKNNNATDISNETNETIDRLKNQITELNDTVDKLNKSNRAKDNRIKDSENNVDRLNRRIEDLNDTITRLGNSNNDAVIKELNTKIKLLSDTIQNKDKQIVQLNNLTSKLNDDIKEKDNQIKTLTNSLKQENEQDKDDKFSDMINESLGW